jgi:hypothetical protein
MKVSAAVAEILKREGVDFVIGYPRRCRRDSETRRG